MARRMRCRGCSIAPPTYPLPQIGALVRRDDGSSPAAWLKVEADHRRTVRGAHRAFVARGQGLGRAVVGALLADAQRRGARTAYLQVTAQNAAALALYRQFGFDDRLRLLVPGAPGRTALKATSLPPNEADTHALAARAWASWRCAGR